MTHEPLSISVTLNEIGRGTIVIDGKDVSDHVRGIAITADASSATQVQLTFVKVDLAFKGKIDPATLADEWARDMVLARAIREGLADVPKGATA